MVAAAPSPRLHRSRGPERTSLYATPELDLWAHERKLEKVQSNLLGL